MAELFEQHKRSLVGVQNVPLAQTSQYGIVRPQPMGVRIHKVDRIVEKPRPEEAPSTLGVVGRYIFTPKIFDHLENVMPGAGGEIQLTDAIAALLNDEPVLAHEFKGERYDCGSKIGYLKATVAFGLKHPAVADDFSDFLTELRTELPSRMQA
jgi:UTP--glucose-1-phosphate uridylyltransferase